MCKQMKPAKKNRNPAFPALFTGSTPIPTIFDSSAPPHQVLSIGTTHARFGGVAVAGNRVLLEITHIWNVVNIAEGGSEPEGMPARGLWYYALHPLGCGICC